MSLRESIKDRALAVRFFLGALCLCLVSVRAQQTSFVYEGKLTDGGAPATGNYDFQFTLREAIAGGNVIGTSVTIAPQAVAAGAFTVSLDFGAGAFNGALRWLELRVRTNGSTSAYTLLT